jgi:hypothetical protein
MGNQAHAQLCKVWARIEKKSHSLWAFTLHNKIHKWMINSKRTQTKTPKFYSIQTTPDEKVGLAKTMKKKL